MKTVYECIQRGIIVHYAASDQTAIEWLENNGGGIFKNTLHNFQINVKIQGR